MNPNANPIDPSRRALVPLAAAADLVLPSKADLLDDEGSRVIGIRAAS